MNSVNGMKISAKHHAIVTFVRRGRCASTGAGHRPDARADKPLHFIHCDLSVPIDPLSINYMCRYAIKFADDFYNKICIYFLKTKNDTVHVMTKCVADMASYGIIK